jgi:acetyl-CoA C-acetyltransferase
MENFMEDIVIVAATRTAVGKFGGTLAKTPAPDLGAAVVVELLKRARLSGEQIGELIFGQVLTAGAGQNPARQTVIKSGLPVTVPALTINAVCGSGLKAVMLAAQAVRDGDSEIVIAGGQESMSLAPHVLPGSRDGQRMGEWKLVDSMIVDGLFDVYNKYHMGSRPRTWPRSTRSAATSRTCSRSARSRRPPPRRKPASSRTRSCPSALPRRRAT